jgi:hypothetical protein
MTVGVLYVLLVRFAVGNDKSARSKYSGPTGKRSAGKLACSVWSGGKVARPYLSLFAGWMRPDRLPDQYERRSSAPGRWTAAHSTSPIKEACPFHHLTTHYPLIAHVPRGGNAVRRRPVIVIPFGWDKTVGVG